MNKKEEINLKSLKVLIKATKELRSFGGGGTVIGVMLKYAVEKFKYVNFYYSVEANKLEDKNDRSKTTHEHTVPSNIIKEMLIGLKDLTLENIQKVLKEFYHTTVVTLQEDAKLRKEKLTKLMPENWDGKNVWARYEVVNIEVL